MSGDSLQTLASFLMLKRLIAPQQGPGMIPDNVLEYQFFIFYFVPYARKPFPPVYYNIERNDIRLRIKTENKEKRVYPKILRRTDSDLRTGTQKRKFSGLHGKPAGRNAGADYDSSAGTGAWKEKTKRIII